MFQFLTHMEHSRSMAAILEMPQYVAYQKNVVYAFIKLSAKSHNFNILRTMDGLSCPTKLDIKYTHAFFVLRTVGLFKCIVKKKQSKISHFSFCNPTTSVFVIFCESVSLIQQL